jgi:hypothetical protein
MDITPTWSAVLHSFLRVGIVKVTDASALDALEHMARVADMYVEEQKARAEDIRELNAEFAAEARE